MHANSYLFFTLSIVIVACTLGCSKSPAIPDQSQILSDAIYHVNAIKHYKSIFPESRFSVIDYTIQFDNDGSSVDDSKKYIVGAVERDSRQYILYVEVLRDTDANSDMLYYGIPFVVVREKATTSTGSHSYKQPQIWQAEILANLHHEVVSHETMGIAMRDNLNVERHVITPPNPMLLKMLYPHEFRDIETGTDPDN